MLPLEKDVELLCDFGLTPNQAKVYIAIVRLGVAAVGKISKASKVRREDIYRLLPALEKMGLTEKVLGTPTKIRAIPVEDALSILIKLEQESANKKMSELMAKKGEFLKHFKAKSKRITEEEEGAQFSLISEKVALLSKGASLLKNAQSEINLVTSRKKLTQLIFTYAELIKNAAKRGVKIRVITEMPDEEDALPRSIEETISPEKSMKLKYAETLPSHFMICDNREMLITTSTHALLAESPSLWTNNAALIEPLQIAFEDLWHTAIDWVYFKTETEDQKMTRFFQKLKPTDHLIFVYETSETKYNVLFNYIKDALDNGEAALYVCSEANTGQIRNAMKRAGINVEKHEKTGALKILDYTQFYIIDGKFSIQNTLELWNKFFKEAQDKGFKGLRVTGETACFFKHNMVHELVEYEKALHRVLAIPMIAICSYRADKLNKTDNPINLYQELASAHGTILFEGRDEKLGKIEIRKS